MSKWLMESYVAIKPFETREQAIEAEQTTIRNECPRHNKFHNDWQQLRSQVMSASEERVFRLLAGAVVVLAVAIAAAVVTTI
jgi:hypothetical protein